MSNSNEANSRHAVQYVNHRVKLQRPLVARRQLHQIADLAAAHFAWEHPVGNGQSDHRRMKVEEMGRLMYDLEAIRESRP